MCHFRVWENPVVNKVGGGRGDLRRNLRREEARGQRPWTTRERSPNSFWHWPPHLPRCDSSDLWTTWFFTSPSNRRLATEVTDRRSGLLFTGTRRAAQMQTTPRLLLIGSQWSRKLPQRIWLHRVFIERGGVPQLNTPLHAHPEYKSKGVIPKDLSLHKRTDLILFFWDSVMYRVR